MSRWLLSLTDPWTGSPEELGRLVGSKGASLRQLLSSGYDVPPGFTITTETVREYRRAGGVWPAGLRQQVEAELSRLEEAVGLSWGCGPLPLTVAVRSGAAESYPGLMRTILSCGWTEPLAAGCDTDLGWREYTRFLSCLLAPEQFSPSLARDLAGRDRVDWPALAVELRRVVRQEFGEVPDEPTTWLWLAIDVVADSADRIAAVSPEAAEHTPPPDETGMPKSDRMVTAITVQAMFRAEVSGVLCSRDPLAPESGRIVLEVVSGDGLALMSGRAQPATYQLSRDPADDSELASAPSGREGGALAALPATLRSRFRSLAVDLERQMGGPVEVEWGAAGDRLVVFQCRSAMAAASPVEREVERLRAWAAQGRRWWVRHQVGEELGTPTPLTWSLWQRFLSPDGGLGSLYRQLGYAPRSFRDSQGCFALIAGRVYVDPDRWVQLICRGYPWRHHPDLLRQRPEHLLEPPTGFDPQRLDPWFLCTWPHLVWVLMRAQWRKQQLSRRAASDFAERIVPRFRQDLERWQADLQSQRDWTEQITMVESLRKWLFDEQTPRLLLPGWLGVQSWQAAAAELRRRLPAARAEELATRLLTLIDRGPVTTGSERGVDATSRVGMLGATSWELSSTLPPPVDLEECGAPPVAAAARGLDDYLPAAERRAIGRGFAAKLQVALCLLPLRDRGRCCLRAGYGLLRELLARVAERSGWGQDLYFLEWEELLRLKHSPVARELLAARRAAWHYWRRQIPPAVIDGTAQHPLAQEAEGATGRAEWKVVALAGGCGEGPVWHPAAPGESCPNGVVIVTEFADSASVLRWEGVAAIVVELGGKLSHAAVTARQIGLPLVVLPGAVRVLPAGGRVRVDADGGRLWQLPHGDRARQG
jgi:phosphohistidine swiveling domain-containing protein